MYKKDSYTYVLYNDVRIYKKQLICLREKNKWIIYMSNTNKKSYIRYSFFHLTTNLAHLDLRNLIPSKGSKNWNLLLSAVQTEVSLWRISILRTLLDFVSHLFFSCRYIVCWVLLNVWFSEYKNNIYKSIFISLE